MWHEIEIPVDTIDMGVPEYEWLMNRVDDNIMRERFQTLYNKPLPDKESVLDTLESKYEKYLSLPILVREYTTVGGRTRYILEDGHRRLTVLVMRKGRTKVKAQLWQKEMTEQDWVDRLNQLSQTIH